MKYLKKILFTWHGIPIIILVVVGILFIAKKDILQNYGNIPSEQAQSKVEKWKIYKDWELPFQFEYPADWSQLTDKNGVIRIFRSSDAEGFKLFNSDESATDIYVGYEMAIYPSVYTKKYYPTAILNEENIYNSFLMNRKEPGFGTPGTTTVRTTKTATGYKVILTDTSTEHGTKVKIFDIIKDTTRIEIRIMYPPVNNEKIELIINHILSTFNFF